MLFGLIKVLSFAGSLCVAGLAGNALPACAQDFGSFYHPTTFAPADASSSSGGGAGDEQNAS